ncbi:single-stranded-DNA-specific exonuclease RecJ [Alkaliphilus crotonatoxidans]
MKLKRYWTYNRIEEEEIDLLTKACGVSPITARILLNRGIKDQNEVRAFLRSSINDLHSPLLLKDMDRTVERIRRAIDHQEAIWIYGDYDVDGVSSAALLVRFFRNVGYPVNYYIPHRMEEGYGLNCDALAEIAAQGGNLIITVDCGITSIKEVEQARELNLDMIITDHHECQGELPRAYAVVNPKRRDCTYPFKQLCGCGVALKLIQALSSKEDFQRNLNQYLDIVALATVADIVPLLNENRIFVKNGIKVMQNSTNLGIQALIEVCGLKGKAVNAGHIGFMLAPRLNAAGRIGNARKAVTLLVTEDEREARELAAFLDEENRLRQQIEMEIFNMAVSMIESDRSYQQDKFIVLYQKGWHHGVIGIVASRIVEKYYKPTVILSIEDGEVKGSARSIPGVNLFEALNQCKELFTKFGGHEQAAGLSLKEENILPFRKRINEIANHLMSEEDQIKKVFCDGVLRLDEINEELLGELETLEPYGMGNPGPKFYSRLLRPQYVNRIGAEGKHLKLQMSSETGALDAIGFNFGEYKDELVAGGLADIVFTPELNVFNGNKKIQLNLKDIKAIGMGAEAWNGFSYCYYTNLSISEKTMAGNLENITLSPDCIVDYNEEVILKLMESQEGLLILANSYYKALQLLSLTDIRMVKSQLKFQFSFGFTVKGPREKEVHIIINPNIDKIDFKRYNKIILLDHFFTEYDFLLFFQRVELNQLIVLFDPEAAIQQQRQIQKIVPKRENLVILYKYFSRTASQGRYSIQQILEGLSHQYPGVFNPAMIQNAFKIFSEGKLLLVEKIQGYYQIKLNKVTDKVDLEALDSYKKFNQLILDFENLKNKLYRLYMRRK